MASIADLPGCGQGAGANALALRHSNLSTTERYLGKISDIEAMKWIDTPYACPKKIRVKRWIVSP
jgi:hypothetical protein